MAQVSPEVRATAEAVYTALDHGDLDAFIALTADDVEFKSLVAEAEGTTFQGHDGVRDWWSSVPLEFAKRKWELLDVQGAGDKGVTHVRISGVLKGIPVEATMWTAFTLRDGKISSWATFRTEHEAPAAAGLEPNGHPN